MVSELQRLGHWQHAIMPYGLLGASYPCFLIGVAMVFPASFFANVSMLILSCMVSSPSQLMNLSQSSAKQNYLSFEAVSIEGFTFLRSFLAHMTLVIIHQFSVTFYPVESQ